MVLTAYNDTYPAGVAATATVTIVEQASACTRYVWQDSPDPAYPFDAWSNAAHTIQEAVDAAVPGDLVLVTNGVYETGSRATPGYTQPNRVIITNDVTVRSVNGPEVTTIKGQGPRGTNAMRCVYMPAGTLIGFTLTNGCTRTDGEGDYDQNGGGLNAFPPGRTAVVSNCILTGNAAYNSGGSTHGTLYNCVIRGNSAARAAGGSSCSTLNNCALEDNVATYYGGGADQCTLNNCTLTGNTAANGGGAYHCTLNNSIAYGNSGTSGANVNWVTCSYSCVDPLQSGTGNIAADPRFVFGAHIAADSPCIGRGSVAYASGTDIDGEAWQNPPAMGCDEPAAGAATGTLSVAINAGASGAVVGAEIAFEADIVGRSTSNRWDFGDGASAANAASVAHAWAAAGEYAVVLTAYNDTYPDGVAATATVAIVEQAPACTRYVWQDSPDPAYPFDAWNNAAHTIQEAVDAAIPGDEVLVTNGVYETGTRVTPGLLLLNRVVITNGIVVRSVNGPEVTVIKGQGPRGSNAVRCVYMPAGTLIGFTLINGHTRTDGEGARDQNGGGLNAYPPGQAAVVSNCILTGNAAYNSGGSTFGTLYNCLIIGNSAARAAGGSSCGTLYNCALEDNVATYYGGGADQCTLNNCTLTENTAMYGGGAYHCTLNNSIAYGNSGSSGENVSWVTCNYSCVAPLQSGTGNVAEDPIFVSGAHIAVDSPCVGRGSVAYAVGTDIDGDAWKNPPAMGCDEPVAGVATGTLAVAIIAEGCTAEPGAPLSFVSDIQGRSTSNRWDFGDGASEANAAAVSHAWAATGEYAVVLTAYNDSNPDGVAATVQVAVVETLAHYEVTATAGTGGTIAPAGTMEVQEGDDIVFQIEADEGYHIARVLLDGDDINEFNAQSQSAVYTLGGVAADHEIEARFNSAPILDVVVSPTQGVAPLRVKFDFTPSFDQEDNIVRSEVFWDEEAGAGWSAEGPATIIGEYAAPGIYTNILRVTDGFGLSDSRSVVIAVYGQAPTAILDASAVSGPAPLSVTLSADESMVATNHRLVTYEWDFNGDGVYDETTTLPTVEHLYGEQGIFAAAVRVTDDQGLQDVASVLLTVSAPLEVPPTVLLTNQPASGPIPLEVVFTAIAADADGTIVSYAWDFDGDGEDDWVGLDQVVTQRYLEVGTFGVSVRVTDDDGLTARASSQVAAYESSKLKTWISSPKDGERVWGSNVTVQAQTAPGQLTGSVQIQYRMSPSGEWSDVGPLLFPPANSYKASWNVAELVSGQAYDLRAVAIDTEGKTVISETVTVWADAAAGDLPGRTLETTVAGMLTKRQTFDRARQGACILADGTAVYVPADSVAADPTILVEVLDASTNPPSGAAFGLTSAGGHRKISIEGGLELQQQITLEIPFADADQDGIVDGTDVPVQTLYAYWFDDAEGAWKRVSETVVDQTAGRVRLKTCQLAEFGLFGDANLLNPARGGYLVAGADAAIPHAGSENLADGNRASYWRGNAAAAESVSFTYGFANQAGAALDEAIIFNAGCGVGAYAKGFEIRTSMDGVSYRTVRSGTLAESDAPESCELGGVTCRYVQVVLTSGYDDGARSLAEVSILGTATADADGDGMADDWEMQQFTSCDPDGTGDYDGDGLDNLTEYQLGGNPTSDDTDGDRMPDAWEAQHGLRLAEADAAADDDGDGKSNFEEYVVGTDPKNAASLWKVDDPVTEGAWQSVGWSTVAGRVYRLYSTTSLVEPWQTNSPPIAGTGGWVTFSNPAVLRQFFAVGAELEP